MDNLQSVFVTEAEELIASLESSLLDFERDLSNRRSVEEIFRVMHTLKGSASMFGFENLSSLTHHLETVYDAIRENQREATVEILEVTLRTVDHIKLVLKDQHFEDAATRQNHFSLLKEIQTLHDDATQNDSKTGTRSVETGTYYLSFKPAEEIFKSGNNPLYIIEDVLTLGQGFVIPSFRPVLFTDSYQPDACHTDFEVIIAGELTEETIRDVFIFVEGKSEIFVAKIAQRNLLEDPAFISALGEPDASCRTSFGFEIIKTIADAVIAPVQKATNVAGPTRTEQGTSIRVSSEKLDELMNLVSELVTSQARLTLLAEQNGIADLTGVSENIEKITRRLRDNAFSICLVPIEAVVTRFQRLVRDLSKELNKDVLFTAEGTETELDKSLIEKITDPILHILRNCMDHGVELPEERIAKGKNPQGRIQFKAFHSGTYVHLEISDDGRGIDPVKVRAKAISKGLVKEDAVLQEQDIIDLLFLPGFSTAEKVTDVSGRGVGMDVVRRNIEAIHGEVSLQSRLNEGTKFTIKLPLTLSIMDGMLVKIASSDYLIPLSMVDKCYEVQTTELSTHASQRLVLDGSLLPVFNLREIFAEERYDMPITSVIKLNYDEFPVGITVDAIVGEYQAVMKPLGAMYQSQDEFSGATILGDGSVALVVDTEKFIRQLIVKSRFEN